MKEQHSKRLFFAVRLLIAGIAFLPLFSCAARIDGSIARDGSALLSVNMSLEPRITALIGRLSAAGGAQPAGQILDGPAIARSMAAAPGVARVSFKNTAPAAIEGTIQISNIGEFLAAGDSKGFIRFNQNSGGGSFVLNISRGNSTGIFERLSPEIAEYLYALMAPLVTGEEMTRAEYLEEISLFYNKPISDEIAASRIRVSIDFPGQITAAKGGTFSGKRANFDIPLLDLLVLESPIVCEVNWK